MADTSHGGLSPVLSDLDMLVDDLGAARARAASAFAVEMHFFAGVAALVRRREHERAQQADTGAVVSASQLAMREIYAEIAAALRLSEYQVASRVNQAHVLMTRFTETMYEVGDGNVSPQHATTIADVGGVIDDPDIRAEYERYAIDLAAELTPAQLKDALVVLVDRLDPDGTQQRVRDAVARRSVRKRSVEPGVGQLIITGPTAQIEGTYNRLTDIATELHTANQADAAAAEAAEGTADAGGRPGEDADTALPHGAASNTGTPAGHTDAEAAEFVPDERTRAQIMADVALDLLLTSVPDGHGTTPEHRDALGAIQATVHLTIPASTLAGTTTGGAQIPGAGLVDDDTARHLAGGSDDWYRIFTDPTTGVPVTVDKRRPCTAMRRLLQARDETCRFPGCPAAPPKSATSTTPSRTVRADPPPCATSPACANATTPSSTTPTGMSSSSRAASSTSPHPPAAATAPDPRQRSGSSPTDRPASRPARPPWPPAQADPTNPSPSEPHRWCARRRRLWAVK
ncbi:DUF222 domain-containing protein [Microbacterium mangrovi]|uniref:DUF222 domain-containing protein n=1 Tax=Microbacterium mangrovi TaxID=1348253 RepID=UPI00057CF467|nr:DUF222 domain-containing protein [Microbacterium mangrovi]